MTDQPHAPEAGLTDAEREAHVRWTVDILRTYDVPSHRAEEIAECLLDEGLVSTAALAARAAQPDAGTLRGAVEALADEWDRDEAYACRNASECVRCLSFQRVVIRLRALLAEHAPEPSAAEGAELTEAEIEDIALSAYSCYRERKPGQLNWLTENDVTRARMRRIAEDVRPAVERILATRAQPDMAEVWAEHEPVTMQGELWCAGCDWREESGGLFSDHLRAALAPAPGEGDGGAAAGSPGERLLREIFSSDHEAEGGGDE